MPASCRRRARRRKPSRCECVSPLQQLISTRGLPLSGAGGFRSLASGSCRLPSCGTLDERLAALDLDLMPGASRKASSRRLLDRRLASAGEAGLQLLFTVSRAVSATPASTLPCLDGSAASLCCRRWLLRRLLLLRSGEPAGSRSIARELL